MYCVKVKKIVVHPSVYFIFLNVRTFKWSVYYERTCLTIEKEGIASPVEMARDDGRTAVPAIRPKNTDEIPLFSLLASSSMI